LRKNDLVNPSISFPGRGDKDHWTLYSGHFLPLFPPPSSKSAGFSVVSVQFLKLWAEENKSFYVVSFEFFSKNGMLWGEQEFSKFLKSRRSINHCAGLFGQNAEKVFEKF